MGDVIRERGLITCRTNTGEILRFENHLLDSGRKFLAKSLLQSESKPVYISHMLFADGGTSNGKPKEVLPTMQQVFGIVRVKKEVISQIDPEMPTRIILSAVIKFEEANNSKINEMALLLSNGDLFSLATFDDLNKTDQMELAWGWEVAFI